MSITRIRSGGPFEQKVGYCRAVVAGGMVHVSGTCSQDPDARDVVAQCRSALSVIGAALEKAGSGWEKVVRVRYLLPNREDFEPCIPLLAEAFGANPPAATMMVCGLLDPALLIEIEVDALL